MLYKRVFQKFSSEFEKNLKSSRKIIQMEKQITSFDESQEIEHNRVATKQPFYRFPFGLSKNFYYMAIPLLLSNITKLDSPFYSEGLTNAFCQINDIYLFGFTGLVGTIVGSHYLRGKDTKYLGLYSGFQLMLIAGQGCFLYNMSPFVFGCYFLSVASHLVWYNYTKQAEGLPKSYINLLQKSLVFSTIFMFVSMGAILVQHEEYKSTEIKVSELQKLSDAWHKAQ